MNLSHHKSFAGCVAVACSVLVGCRSDSSPRTDLPSKTPLKPVAATPEAQKVAAGYNEFGFRLLRALAKNKKADNVCLSPFSITTALAMANNGATGQTRRELDTLLGTASFKAEALNKANQNLSAALQSADPAVTLNIANSLWANEKVAINTNFIADAKQFFDAQAESTDLTSTRTQQRINDWCSEKPPAKFPPS